MIPWKKGVILNMTPIASFIGLEGTIFLEASKGTVIALTKNSHTNGPLSEFASAAFLLVGLRSAHSAISLRGGELA